MRNIIRFLFSVFVFFFVGCKGVNKDNKYYLESKEIIEVDAGFHAMFSNIYSDDNSEYIFLWDAITYKQAVFYDLRSKKIIDQIQLDTVAGKLPGIETINVRSRDSIFVLANYSNKIFLIDNDGVILEKYDFDSLICQNKRYTARKSNVNEFIDDRNRVLVNCEYSYYNDDVENKPDKWDEWRSNSHKSPYLFMINDLFDDSIQTKFFASNFYNRFTTSRQEVLEVAKYLSSKESVFIFSIFVDTIYEYSLISGDLKKLHHIQSNYTNLGYEPPTVNQVKQGYHNTLAQTKGIISGLIYDEFTKRFLVTVQHEIPIETPQTDRLRPWSILIYDSEFNKLGEIKMDEKKYKAKLYVTSKGILVPTRILEQKDEDYFNKTTFELFELVQN
ncbi:MAG: hypothetical protein WDZ35_15550 [Crocinitomicaceae bacterium]